MNVDQVIVYYREGFVVELVECCGSISFREIDQVFSDAASANRYAEMRAMELNASFFSYGYREF